MYIEDMNVILIEALEKNRLITKKTLTAIGFKMDRIKEFSDPGDGVDFVRKGIAANNPVHFSVVSDDVTSGFSGLDFVNAIRKTKGAEKLPCLYSVGNPEKNALLEAVKVGVSAIVVRPINQNSLTQKLHEMLKAAKLVD